MRQDADEVFERTGSAAVQAAYAVFQIRMEQLPIARRSEVSAVLEKIREVLSRHVFTLLAHIPYVPPGSSRPRTRNGFGFQSTLLNLCSIIASGLRDWKELTV